MKKEIILKITKICTIVCAVITLISFVGDFIMKHILVINNSKEASSIGIIGGADGPTTIFLASSGSYSINGMFGILTVIGIIIYMYLKNKTI